MGGCEGRQLRQLTHCFVGLTLLQNDAERHAKQGDRACGDRDRGEHDAPPHVSRRYPTPLIVVMRLRLRERSPSRRLSDAIWVSSVFVEPHQCSSHTSLMRSSRFTTTPG